MSRDDLCCFPVPSPVTLRGTAMDARWLINTKTTPPLRAEERTGSLKSPVVASPASPTKSSQSSSTTKKRFFSIAQQTARGKPAFTDTDAFRFYQGVRASASASLPDTKTRKNLSQQII